MATKKNTSTTKKHVKSESDNRTHLNFRLTRRRDYDRPLNVPGYVAFTKYVNKTLWKNRKIFIPLAIIYAVITALMVGIASQETYSTLSETLRTAGGDLFNGFWGGISKTSLLFTTAVSGGISQTMSDAQQIYAGLITLLTWLTSVWLLRNILAGRKITLRDGLYNSGSPLLPTFLVALLFFVQLLPLAVAFIGYSAALAVGLLDGGVEAMLFWFAAGLLATLSLYWITSTAFALIIITLPGMYPMQAVKTAGQLVANRRLRVLLRFLWMVVVAVVYWGIGLIPVIILDSWVKSILPVINWLPLVPLAILILSSLTIVWISGYAYLFYRKVVDDDSDAI